MISHSQSVRPRPLSRVVPSSSHRRFGGSKKVQRSLLLGSQFGGYLSWQSRRLVRRRMLLHARQQARNGEKVDSQTQKHTHTQTHTHINILALTHTHINIQDLLE